jgi:cobalt-zinc-cadmium efflux system membrane fusion protein
MSLSPVPAARRAVLLLVAAASLAACKDQPEPRAVQAAVMEGERIRFPADSPQLSVLQSTPVKDESRDVVLLPARLVWDETRTVRIMPPLGGRIVRLQAAPGDTVKAGAPLASLSSPDLGQAQADARRAEADLDLAEKNLSRARELHEHGVVALKEFQTAQAEHDRAQAERDRTRARLKLYGGSAQVDQDFVLRSPVSGVVVERNANPGQEVRPDQAQPGSPSLFVVSDPTHLWVQVDAPESALGALKQGGVLKLRSPLLGDDTVAAKIQLVSDFFDPQSRTVRVRASVDNSARRLKAEMYATAEIDVDRGHFMRVPASAVLLRGRTQYAFVDEGDGRYRRQAVQAEEGEFGTMRVKSGLADGDRVVTEGGPLLMQMFGTK